MLINLQIKDFLLIDELELDFFSGLTVITGETGSGKSITIDALLLIFGAKANSDIIRAGQAQASFTATFQIDNPKILTWLRDREFLNHNAENLIICRRVIDRNGRSKAYINGLPVNISSLKELGEMLLDIHTQHASIALLKAENQRQLLDEFAGTTGLVAQLNEKYQWVTRLQQKLAQAREFSQDLIIKQEILQEKINDLNGLNLEANEWDTLQIQQKRLANAEFLLQELDYSLNILGTEQNSIIDMLAALNQRLEKLNGYLPNYIQVSQLVNSLEAESSELEHELQLAANKIEQDPQLLAQIDKRIDEIYSLARKYRIRPEDINSCLEKWQVELHSLAADTDFEGLAQELEKARQEYLELAQTVSLERNLAAKILRTKVTSLINQLSISGKFEISIIPSETWLTTGIDNISYQVCFNQGMALQPLNKVASGGELSRVALAIYVTLSINNPPELIVFDEIDVGIGGGVAEVVGKLLKELGLSKQVICITHQPQTACCGNYHLQVSKAVHNGNSYSRINYVAKNDRIKEIARMLGGINITNTTLEHAKEMLTIQV